MSNNTDSNDDKSSSDIKISTDSPNNDILIPLDSETSSKSPIDKNSELFVSKKSVNFSITVENCSNKDQLSTVSASMPKTEKRSSLNINDAELDAEIESLSMAGTDILTPVTPNYHKSKSFDLSAEENKELNCKMNRVAVAQLANDLANSNNSNEHKRWNRYGFYNEEDSLPLEGDAELKKREVLRRDNERALKWAEMFKDWDYWVESKSSKLKERIRKGIADGLRVYAYQRLLGSIVRQKKEPNLYLSLLNDPKFKNDPVQQEAEAVIIRDLHRTLPNHVFFSQGNPGQHQLFNVLKAYSRYDPPVNYCQSMGFIAAVLLIYITEEETFWILVSLLKGDRHMMRSLYLPGLPLTMQYMFIFEKLLTKFDPEMAHYLEENCIPISSFTSKWFMTIFASLPFTCMIRIWDCYIYEGPKILFRVALAIMKIGHNVLMSGSDADFQENIKIISKNMDPDNLLEVAFKFSLKKSHIEDLCKQYEKMMAN